jgi:hypothetical protein
MAGLFNRASIPPEEMYLDQKLSCVPDFEMLVRLALRFGEHRIVCKEAITMTASATPVSMAWRPEARLQLERDTLIVLERLLSGDLHKEFIEFLRTEFSFNLFRSYADRLHSLLGETDLTRRYIALAVRLRPHDPSLKRFAHASRHFTWDEREHRLRERSNVKPMAPPPSASLLHSVELPTAVVIDDKWSMDGASTTTLGKRAVISTPVDPWHYAAVLKVPIANLDLRSTWAWLKVRIHQTKGLPMLSLFSKQSDEIVGERPAQAENGGVDFFFDLFSHSLDHLLVRNGSIPQTSELEIESVELWGCPAPGELEPSDV